MHLCFDIRSVKTKWTGYFLNSVKKICKQKNIINLFLIKEIPSLYLFFVKTKSKSIKKLIDRKLSFL